MNVNTIYGTLQSRSKISSVFCGIYAGIMWIVVVLSAAALGLAGTLGGTFFGKLNDIDRNSVVAGYEVLGNLFLSALMGFAVIVILVCVFLLTVPAVLFTIAAVGGFSKSKKEMTAVQTPGVVVDFRLFKKDAIYKLVISGLTMGLVLWSEIQSFGRSLRTISGRNPFESNPFSGFRFGGNISLTGVGVTLLVLSPAIVVFVLSVMNLSDIQKWQRWLDGVRAQNQNVMQQGNVTQMPSVMQQGNVTQMPSVMQQGGAAQMSNAMQQGDAAQMPNAMQQRGASYDQTENRQV